jgi:tetratricopeptide (TPR) repeat protein
MLMQELEWAAHYRGDRPEYLDRLAEEAERAVVRAATAAPRASPRLIRLPVLWLTGRWDEAQAAARLAGPPGIYGEWIWPGPWFARILRAQGARDAAWELVRRAMPGGPAADPHTEIIQTLALQALAAELALDAGDLPRARAWREAHDRWLALSGAVLGRAEGQLGWAAYHRAAGDPQAARAGAERARAHAADPRQPLALLAAHRTLGEFDTEAGRHADAAAHLDAALALADACAAPYERALTLLALAELRAVAGDRDGAGATLDEARTICAPLEARPALARAAALAGALVASPAPAPAVPPAYPAGLSARGGGAATGGGGAARRPGGRAPLPLALHRQGAPALDLRQARRPLP